MRRGTPWRASIATIEKTPGTFPHTLRDARGGAGSRPASVLFPAPPPWLQKVGRFRGTAEDSRGLGDGVESSLHQPFAPETRVSRDFPKLPLRGCNSRRLHQHYSRGFAPRTPLHALSLAASPARSDRVARSLRSLAALNTPTAPEGRQRRDPPSPPGPHMQRCDRCGEWFDRDVSVVRVAVSVCRRSFR